MQKFNFSNTSKLYFGEGTFNEIPKIILNYGNKILLILGGHSFQSSDNYIELERELKRNKISYWIENVKSEPSPSVIDEITNKYREECIEAVVSIGGGSVIDAGKSISAMLTKTESVREYLEGIGTKQHDGSKIPFIAVPTTSGTGSEATKNAVISEIGPEGFKKSLRHDNFIPDCAVIDPVLLINCPKNVTAASGMDAFSQLIEGYLSTESSPITDALAFSGLKYMREGLLKSYKTGNDMDARGKVAYASYLSGVVLANAGLGTVHGFASPIGGFFDIPHGVVCGTLIGEFLKVNIKKLREDPEKNEIYLEKYAEVGRIFSGKNYLEREAACDSFISAVSELIENMGIPKLGKYGIRDEHLDKIVEITGNKYNPVELNKDELKEILRKRL